LCCWQVIISPDTKDTVALRLTRSLTILALLSLPVIVAAQRVSIQPVAGLGLGYVSKKHTATSYQPRFLPSAGVSVFVPLGSDLGIKTGALYQQKGWHSLSQYKDDADFLRLDFTSTVKLHEIALPMLLTYRTKDGQKLQYFFSAGVSYGFILMAGQEDKTEIYRRGELESTSTRTWHPNVALLPDDTRLKSGYDGTMYYLFNTSMRAELGVCLRQRYSLQAFWEQTLNSISSVTGDAASLKAGYCGISLGVTINRPNEKEGAQ
jgi:hypothetical protein